MQIMNRDNMVPATCLTLLVHDCAVCSHADVLLLQDQDSGLVTLYDILLTHKGLLWCTVALQ